MNEKGFPPSKFPSFPIFTASTNMSISHSYKPSLHTLLHLCEVFAPVMSESHALSHFLSLTGERLTHHHAAKRRPEYVLFLFFSP